jgi:hypothetical protein
MEEKLDREDFWTSAIEVTPSQNDFDCSECSVPSVRHFSDLQSFSVDSLLITLSSNYHMHCCYFQFCVVTLVSINSTISFIDLSGREDGRLPGRKAASLVKCPPFDDHISHASTTKIDMASRQQLF